MHSIQHPETDQHYCDISWFLPNFLNTLERITA